jgi:hypothetical protein
MTWILGVKRKHVRATCTQAGCSREGDHELSSTYVMLMSREDHRLRFCRSRARREQHEHEQREEDDRYDKKERHRRQRKRGFNSYMYIGVFLFGRRATSARKHCIALHIALKHSKKGASFT